MRDKIKFQDCILATVFVHIDSRKTKQTLSQYHKIRLRLVERDGRAHSVLVSESLDSSVRWLEFPHIPEFLSKNVHVGGGGDREYGEGGNREYERVYLGRGNSGNCEGIRNQRRPYCSGIDHTLLFFSISRPTGEVKPR